MAELGCGARRGTLHVQVPKQCAPLPLSLGSWPWLSIFLDLDILGTGLLLRGKRSASANNTGTASIHEKCLRQTQTPGHPGIRHWGKAPCLARGSPPGSGRPSLPTALSLVPILPSAPHPHSICPFGIILFVRILCVCFPLRL